MGVRLGLGLMLGFRKMVRATHLRVIFLDEPRPPAGLGLERTRTPGTSAAITAHTVARVGATGTTTKTATTNRTTATGAAPLSAPLLPVPLPLLVLALFARLPPPLTRLLLSERAHVPLGALKGSLSLPQRGIWVRVRVRVCFM